MLSEQLTHDPRPIDGQDTVSSMHTEPPGLTSYARLFFDVLNFTSDGDPICFVFPEGRVNVGSAHKAPADIVVDVHDPKFFQAVMCHGNLGLGEAYMAGQFSVRNGGLPRFLTALLKARLPEQLKLSPRLVLRYLGVRCANALFGTAHNVRRHYDIGQELFDAFLEDRFQVYSCGYAKNAQDSIEILQQQKLDRICDKLELQPQHRLLDIGCGNGGLVIHAARRHGVIATGVTNSCAHSERARANVKALGLENSVEIVLADYKTVQGQFDRIVSVGMLEHIPAREYPRYFSFIKQHLSKDGRGLVHAIGKNADRNDHDPFIQQYIFPGSDTPRLSDISGNLERQRLAILDVENMVRHYAVTTTRWLESFIHNENRLTAPDYDQTFKRMWEYYLSCGIAVALAGDLSLYQVLFTNDYSGDYRFERV